MTIKSKLIANVVLTAAIIIGISLTSFFSIRFLQDKLSYLTEKSTPFQMRTMAFQRELQSSITDLIKVSAAQNLTEYTTFRAEAERELKNVKYAQELLEKLNSGTRQSAVSEELNPIADELFVAVNDRIKSDTASSEANTKVTRLMKDSSIRLRELDTYIRNLQVTRSAAFARALENTGQLSARLRVLEELLNLFTELHSVSDATLNAHNSNIFFISKGKIKTLLGRINRNEYGKTISSDLKMITDDLNEFLQLHEISISKRDEESKQWASESLKELAENINHINLKLNQEIELASSKLSIETSRQGIIFAQSNSANSILLANSELVAMGLTVTGEINRLFTLDTLAKLDKLDLDIRRLFNKISEQVKLVESSLVKLDAREEFKMLRAAANSLAAIRNEIYSANGIVATLKMKLNANEQASKSADKLHAVVIKQSAHGNESISTAQEEQERSIAAVNSMVKRSLSQIAVIGFFAILIGILFGYWIYRSVLLPLRVVLGAVRRQQEQGQEKARLAEAVAGGDLSREVNISEPINLDPASMNKDEIGMVLNSVVGMSEAQVTLDMAFAGMTTSLRISRTEEARRDRLKNGLYELNKILREEHKTSELADEALAFLADFLGAGVGIMYLYDEKGEMLQTLSTFAISKSKRLNWGFGLGEGLPGQVALERKTICLNSVPPDYLPIASAMGEADPLNVVIMPIQHNDTLAGVLELGSFKQFNEDDFDFLNQSLEGIAIAININRSRQVVIELLEQAQRQTEDLNALRQTSEIRWKDQ